MGHSVSHFKEEGGGKAMKHDEQVEAENAINRKLDALRGAVVMLAGASRYTSDAALIVSDLEEAWEERAYD